MKPSQKTEPARDAILLAARILLMLLFLIFGLEKVTGFGQTASLFAHMGVPLPTLATLVAIMVELGMGMLLVLGLFTRPLAILMALYTCATAFIGHHYWTLSGSERFFAEIDFFKNVAIAGGLLLLYVAGPGRHSLDRKLRLT